MIAMMVTQKNSTTHRQYRFYEKHTQTHLIFPVNAHREGLGVSTYGQEELEFVPLTLLFIAAAEPTEDQLSGANITIYFIHWKVDFEETFNFS